MEKPNPNELPFPIRTRRLLIRPIAMEDVAPMLEGIHESREKLQKWMPWAENIGSLEEYQDIVAKGIVKFNDMEEIWLLAFTHDGRFIVSTGFHDIRWKIPRCEIGYWCRTSEEGKGYTTEAVNALAHYAFEVMKMRKVVIGMDTENNASEAVARKANFIHEFDDIGGLTIPNCDDLRIKRNYSCFDPKTLAALEADW